MGDLHDPDAALLARLAQHDPAAMRLMVTRKLPRLLALAGRLLNDPGDAQDIAQETLLRAWKQAADWRPGAARFDTWLHRVAINLCYDHLRRRRETPMAEVPEQIDPGPMPDRGLLARDIGGRVALAMAALPQRQREAIVLCHYQELGNIEAAKVMGTSVEALESLLGRARRTLRSALMDLAKAS